MSFFEAMTGKIYNYNKSKFDSNKRVCYALKGFVSSRLSEYPNNEALFTNARDWLYAYYMASTIVIDQCIKNLLSHHRSTILQLNCNNYMRLISALQSGSAISYCIGNLDEENAESWLYLQLEGIAEMYDQPNGYFTKWMQNLEYASMGKDAAGARIAGKVFDEIAPILSAQSERCT